MDRLDAMRVFVAVADHGGFAAAARRLAMSPPTVTRAIAALEERIGTRLLQRTTRRVRLTEAGAHFLVDCRRILPEVDEAEASAAGDHADARGHLTVTASIMFGRLYVVPILLDFLARHPLVTVRSLFIDRIVNLVDEGLDVAVRIAHLADSSLAAVRVGQVRRVVCASPSYLAARGTPRRPEDLGDLDAIGFALGPGTPEWTFGDGTRSWTVRPPARLTLNNAEVAVAAAVAGHGLTRVLSYQVDAEVRAGRLAIVLAEYEPPPLPIHLVHTEGRRASGRVRAFIELAAERLRAAPALR